MLKVSKIHRSSLLLIISLTAITFACKRTSTYGNIFAPFENLDKPEKFAPELSIEGNTFKGCFSFDYSTFYFFRYLTPDAEDYRIFQSEYIEGKWSVPVKISFSDTSSDLYPVISPLETDKLYFTSYRRIPGDTSTKTSANFWYSSKINGDWSKPEPFTKANLIYNYNSQPCITNSGNIYFTSYTPDWKKISTYMIPYENGSYKYPVDFTPVMSFRDVDTTRTIFEVCVSPEEDYMILVILGKEQDTKLYLSNNEHGSWTTPVYLGDILTVDMSGNFPYITADGRFLIFTKAFSGFYILPTKAFRES